MKNYHKADCVLRIIWGVAFVVIGLLYIPWLAILGGVVCLSLVASCTRLSYRFGLASRQNKTNENK